MHRLRSLSPLLDEISRVEFIPPSQTDLTVVNAARVSFNKQSSIFTLRKDLPKGSDEGLIEYLVNHNHWTPIAQPSFVFRRNLAKDDYIRYVEKTSHLQYNRVLLNVGREEIEFLERGSAYAYLSSYDSNWDVMSHIHEKMPYTTKAFSQRDKWSLQNIPQNSQSTDVNLVNPEGMIEYYMDLGIRKEELENLFTMTFRIVMPVFICRQHTKSTVGYVRNEVSRRYISSPPEFYIPSELRMKDNNVKQGSSERIIADNDETCNDIYFHSYQSRGFYQNLLELGVCGEQSRMILPQNMYTEFIETGTVNAIKRYIGLRSQPYAQKEIREYADAILKIARDTNLRVFFDEDSFVNK